MKVHLVAVRGLRLLPRPMSLPQAMRRRRHRLVSPPATLCTRSWIYWPRSVALLTSRRRARGLVSRPARLSRTLHQVPSPTISLPAHPQANVMSTVPPPVVHGHVRRPPRVAPRTFVPPPPRPPPLPPPPLPIFDAEAFQRAVSSNDVAAVRALLAVEWADSDWITEHVDSAIDAAAERGNLPLLEALLANPDAHSELDEALEIAARNDNNGSRRCLSTGQTPMPRGTSAWTAPSTGTAACYGCYGYMAVVKTSCGVPSLGR